MITCNECGREVTHLVQVPAHCESCHKEVMNSLAKVWLDSGAKQERDRLIAFIDSLLDVRRPPWVKGGDEKTQETWKWAIESVQRSLRGITA